MIILKLNEDKNSLNEKIFSLKYMKVLHPEEALKELGLKEQQIKFTSTLEISDSTPIDNERFLDSIKELIQQSVLFAFFYF